MITEIIILLVCFMASGFFSGIEAAFFSVSRLQLKELVRQKARNVKALETLKKDPHRFIITDLIGNNIANILAASIATKIALDAFGDSGIGIATGIMTLLILIYGEIIPKAYCSANAVKVALFSAPIITFLSVIFKPIIVALEFITKLKLKLLGVKDSNAQEKVSEDTIKDLLATKQRDGTLKKQETEMISNIFEFDDRVVEDIMITRENATVVSIQSTLEEVLAKMNESGYSRLPVYKGTRDNIVGVIHLKTIVNAIIAKRKPRISTLMTKPYFVPERKKINQLLRQFRLKQMHMAVVVNEYGSFEGIVTLEDVIEQVVGDIDDETDIADEDVIKKVDAHTFLVKGDCEIEDFNHIVKTRIPHEDVDYDTISGLILEKLERIPKKGEKVDINSLQITIKDVSAKKIRMVEVQKKTRRAYKSK